MGSPWRQQSQDITMSGELKDLERRIKENEGRGMVLISKPKPIKSLYVEYQFDYSTLHKRSFQGKVYHDYEKWICKMRRPVLIES